MGQRPLSSDEAALWARVMAGVRPLRAVVPATVPAVVAASPASAGPRKATGPKPLAALAPKPASPLPVPAPRPAGAKKVAPSKSPGNTLDGTWDRQLARGLAAPDRTIDLHGHTLQSAHDLLDAALAAGIRDGDRVILLVTGKPPRPTSERPHNRGAIRAATGDWLAGSRHSSAIAAVRAAHPRHGGAGALYIVLKRPRSAR